MVANAVVSENVFLEDFTLNLPEHMEWVDGQLVEKSGMTLQHSEIQINLGFYWKSYTISSGQGGKVYSDVPCRTTKQRRRPDVAYLTPELVAQFGKVDILPQSFPLIAEIVSPTDVAEDVFLKAQEYLQSSCEEVWLVFPESRLVLVMTQSQIIGFKSGEVVSTQRVLLGFSVAVDELLA
ncbi:MAG: Uma2 family endonuclease [Cyanobacteriota bacterium]|nr:Uma2 family endonuclease [Cyanobacteriota bacterium]